MALVRTIAGRSLSQRPGRTVFSILGIAIGIVTVVGVFTLDHNTVVGMSRRSLDEWRPELEVQADAAMQDPRGALEARLLREKRGRLWQSWLAAARAGAKIEINKELLSGS